MNTNNKQFWALLGGEIVLAVLVIVALVGGNQSGTFGSGTRFPHGISADSTLPSAGQVRGTTLTITGATTLSGTLGVTATTTLSDGVKFDNPGICLEFYATSTATRWHMVASTTATIEGVDGVMMIEYGACAY